jgi:muramoyltetrapeptide carboxypeptidase
MKEGFALGTLSHVAATAGLNEKLALIKPAALKPGDTIAIISPAAPSDASDFEKGLALLKAAGYSVKLMPSAQKRHGFLAARDEERLADFHAAFADKEVKAILCARGGYGCMRLLAEMDFELIAKNPKIFIGFSDITSLLNPFYQRLGLVGFYGPMLTSNLIHDEVDSQKELFSMVSGSLEFPYVVPNHDPYYVIQAGSAEGPLIGGNLSLLTSLCGTPYQPDAKGHILFIEDWKEKRYSLDRQFQQLKLAGFFEGIKGLILADFSEIEEDESQTLPEFLKQVVLDLKLDVPAGYGFSVGHGEQTGTLPFGISARFDASTGQLTLLESPVIPN